jgi:hypothetical protein
MNVVSSYSFLYEEKLGLTVCCKEFGNKTLICYPELFLCDGAQIQFYGGGILVSRIGQNSLFFP